MKKFRLSVIVFSLLLIACKKEEIVHSSISGYVINNATSERFPDIGVHLVTEFKGSKTNELTAVTDGNGHFAFNNAEINFSDKYSYFLSVRNIDDGQLYLEGVEVELLKNSISQQHVLGVYPTMKRLTLHVPFPFNNYPPDSFVVTLQQKDVLINLPGKNTTYTWPTYIFVNYGFNNQYSTSGPMGKWYVKTEMWKSSVYSSVSDSVVVGWGEEKDFFIPW